MQLSVHPPEQSAPGDDAGAACTRAIASVRRKADSNERLARVAMTTIIRTSALVPVSLIVSAQSEAFVGAS